MEERFNRLAEQLIHINRSLSKEQALTWVEGLWEDFESSRARAGYDYAGQDATEAMVLSWIKSYGPRLHEYSSDNPKFQRYKGNSADAKPFRQP
ncbi:YfhJ family protein [Fictibacillus iocasae]|uniref:YfhJ family protein n=1 Tax=Fictibacillus iocasae TaxID=2715437 RepID=A0ABW2NUU8_9BACL